MRNVAWLWGSVWENLLKLCGQVGGLNPSKKIILQQGEQVRSLCAVCTQLFRAAFHTTYKTFTGAVWELSKTSTRPITMYYKVNINNCYGGIV